MIDFIQTARGPLLAGSLVMSGLANAHDDPTAFDDSAFAEQTVTVDCTFEDGAAATCYRA
ncbi:MAG: hypothetical protein P1V13_17885 [Rhizobiaceae bacterium]|nr:hypothetical protein [Rhizobiaceae bacterium]